MSARILEIEERRAPAPGELAGLADFTYTEGDEVDPEVVVDDPHLSLYCFDDEGRRAIFTQLPPDVDLTQVPFVYETQNEQAKRLVAVPYDDFLGLAAGLPEVENLISVFNTGRSGSTLISHAFNASEVVVSLSEPDAATQVARLRTPDGSRDAEISGLLDAAVRFLFKPNPHKQGSAFALKLRAEAVRAIDLYGSAFSRAKSLYSYREALGWVRSFYRVTRFLGSPELETIGWWVGYLGRSLKRGEGEVRAYLGEGEDVPAVKALAVWWLFLMEDLVRQSERVAPIMAVRYDDLNTQRERVLHEIFAYCGLPASGVDKALGAFGRDAQAGTWLARENPQQGNTLRLSDQQIADVHDVLHRHPVINTPDFTLLGTLTV